MATPQSLDAALARLAGRQLGLVTLHQLAEAGVSYGSLRRRLLSGKLVRAGARVYAIAGSADGWERRALAACLDLGPEAVLSHQSAATAWHLDVRPASEVHLTVPYGHNVRRRARGLRVHRSREVTRTERTRVGRLPVTSLNRTVVDLASVLREEALGRVIDDVLCRRLTTPDRLLSAIELSSQHKRKGTAALWPLVTPWQEGRALDSVAEGVFRRAMARAGLPDPEVQHVVEGAAARVDFAWPDSMVVLEVDSFRWHADPLSHARDSERANRLAALGWTVLHATPAELDTAAAGVLDALRSHLVPPPA